MPAEGIQYLPKRELLTFEEIERTIALLARLGISKVRLTGGEPFVRMDLMRLIRNLVETPGVNDLHITTNGVLTAPHVAELKRLGIASVNLSLDTLNAERFKLITRRAEFGPVMRTLELLLKHDIPTKINAVVMEGKNIEDILPLVELTRQQAVEVRFIEEMPFNGEGSHYPTLHWNYARIHSYLKEHFPDLHKIPDPANATATQYAIPGHKGTVGIIAAFSRTFCGTCNRIRITAQGTLKTCLYDEGVLDIRQLLRSGDSDDVITEKLLQVFRQRPKDGFEAEASRSNHLPAHESMSTIGG